MTKLYRSYRVTHAQNNACNFRGYTCYLLILYLPAHQIVGPDEKTNTTLKAIMEKYKANILKIGGRPHYFILV
jgi:hypothetical protein